MALRLLWAASGENAVVFSDEEFQALVQERGNTIKALKLELMSRGFGSRFRLRLLRAGEHLELSDDVVIVPPLVLKMVRLAFLPADEERDEEFLEACAEGHLEEVERRLHQPQDPNTADAAALEKYAALHVAASNGHLDVVRILLEAGASCDSDEGIRITPLHWAAEMGHLEVVSLLLQAGASSNAADAHGRTALCWAADNGHLEVVRTLLEAGASCDQATTDNSEFPLLSAAAAGYLEIVRLWLRGHQAVVRLLLAARGDGADETRETPFHLAALNGHMELVHLLLEAGTSCNQATSQGTTALHCAAQNGHLEVVHVLLKAGAAYDHATVGGWTALHFAAWDGHLEVVRLLVEIGSACDATTHEGETPA